MEHMKASKKAGDRCKTLFLECFCLIENCGAARILEVPVHVRMCKNIGTRKEV
jgi:hypothetical protein